MRSSGVRREAVPFPPATRMPSSRRAWTIPLSRRRTSGRHTARMPVESSTQPTPETSAGRRASQQHGGRARARSLPRSPAPATTIRSKSQRGALPVWSGRVRAAGAVGPYLKLWVSAVPFYRWKARSAKRSVYSAPSCPPPPMEIDAPMRKPKSYQRPRLFFRKFGTARGTG